MFTSGEKLLLEIITTQPPARDPAPDTENDLAALASRSEKTMNTIKSLLEPLKKRRRAHAEKAAAQAASHAAQERRSVERRAFVAGLQTTREQAKGLLEDCVELLEAITAQVSEAAAIRAAVFAQTDDIVGTVYTAHKRHYEVQALLDSIVQRTGNATLEWLREFNDARQALPLKMVIQARMAASLGWKEATNVQWPVVVATYELLVPLAERLKGELVGALAEDEVWVAPRKKTAVVTEGRSGSNSRGARLAFAETAQVQVFMKEEIVHGETSKCKTYQVYLADGKNADDKTDARSVVKSQVASLESKEKRGSMSMPSPRRFSFGTPSARKASVSTPPSRSVPAKEEAAALEASVFKDTDKKGFVSRLPVRKDSTSSFSSRRNSTQQPATLKGFMSRLPVRKESVSMASAPKIDCP